MYNAWVRAEVLTSSYSTCSNAVCTKGVRVGRDATPSHASRAGFRLPCFDAAMCPSQLSLNLV